MVFGMGGSNAIEVVVNSDTSGFVTGIDRAIGAITSFKGAVAGLGAGISLASFAVIGEAIEKQRELNQITREFGRVMPEREAAIMTDRMNELANTIPLSTAELGKIGSEAAQFGVEGEESITTFTEVVAKMATATSLTADEAGVALARIANQLQMPIEETENLGSSINELSNNMATSTSEIVTAVSRSAASMTLLGSSRTEIVALNSSLIDAGIEASAAGRSLRRLAQEMSDPRKVEDFAEAVGMTPDEFKAMRKEDPTGLLLTMADTMNDGGTNAEILGSTLTSFSQRALSVLGQNLDKTNRALDMSADAYEENTSLAAEYENMAGSLGNRMQILRNRIDGVLVSIGQHFVPIVKAGVEVVIDMVDAISAWNQKTDGMLGAIALASGAIGGLIATFASLASMVSGTVVAGAIATFIGALTTVGAVVATLGIAIAAFAKAYETNFAGIRDATNNVVNVIREEFMRVFVEARELVSNVMDTFSQLWNDHRAQVEPAVTSIVDLIENRLVDTIRGLGDIVSEVLSQANMWWQEHGDEVVDAVVEIITFLGDLADEISNVDSKWRVLLPTIGLIGAALLGLINPVTAVIGVVAGLGIAWERNLFGIRDVTRDVMTTVKDIFNELETAIRPIVEAALNGIKELWDTHGSDIIEILRTFKELAESVFNDAMEVIDTVVSNALNEIENLWNAHGQEVAAQIADFITNAMALFNQLLSIILPIIQTFLDAAKAFWDTWGDEIMAIVEIAFTIIQGVVGTALDLIITLFRTQLAVASGIMEFWTAVLQGDWDAAWNAIETTVKEVVDIIVGFLERTFNGVVQFFVDWGDEMLSTAEEAWQQIQDHIETVSTEIEQFIIDVFTAVLDWLGGWAGDLLSWAEETWNDVKQAIIDFGNWLVFGSYIQDMFNAVLDSVKDLMGQTLDSITNILGDIESEFQSKLDSVLDTATTKFDDVRSSADNLMSQTSDSVSGHLNDIKSFFEGQLSQAQSITSSKLESAKNTAASKMSTMQSRIGGILDGIVSDFRSAFSRASSLASSIISKASDAASRASSLLSDARSSASRASSLASDAGSVVDDVVSTVSGAFSGGGGGGSSSGTGGCFVGNSPVLTADDGWVTIDDVEVGDEVVSMHADGRVTTSVVGEVLVHEDDHDYGTYDLREVGFLVNNKVLQTRVTSNHLFRQPGGTWRPIGEIDTGEKVTHVQGTALIVRNAPVVDEPTVYNLHMAEGPHNYAVHGAIVHNAKGFAHGGIVTEPTRAIIGEAGSSEAVIPLNRRGRAFMRDALGDVGGGGGSGVHIENLYTQAETRAQARNIKHELAAALESENMRR